MAAYDGFEFRPPVRQGELYAAACRSPRAIGIIDGYFDGQPAVLHKEILWALARGIAVFGASSMGALRAAELHSFGMRGVGRIFEAYRDGELTDDDEVALIHGPPETGYIRLSEPMVNIRATLEKAVEERIIDQATGARLAAGAKARFYQLRTWRGLLAGYWRSRSRCEELSAWLRTGKVDRKRDDGLELLSEMDAFIRSGAKPERTDLPFRVDRELAQCALAQRNTEERRGDDCRRGSHPRRTSVAGRLSRKCVATPCFDCWLGAAAMQRPIAKP